MNADERERLKETMDYAVEGGYVTLSVVGHQDRILDEQDFSVSVILALLRADATLEHAKKVIKARIASIPPLDDFRMEPREREALRDALALLTEEKP